MNLPSIHHLHISHMIVKNVNQNSPVEHLTVHQCYDTSLMYMPNLRTLTVNSLDCSGCLLNFSSPITHLSIERSVGTWMFYFTELLVQLSSLVYLKIRDTSKLSADGSHWQNALPNSVKKFELITEFSDAFLNHSSILQSFQTPFWLVEKNWYINCEYHTLSKKTLLYTIPYYAPDYCFQLLSSIEFASTSLDHLENKMNNVKQLTIDTAALASDTVNVSTF